MRVTPPVTATAAKVSKVLDTLDTMSNTTIDNYLCRASAAEELVGLAREQGDDYGAAVFREWGEWQREIAKARAGNNKACLAMCARSALQSKIADLIYQIKMERDAAVATNIVDDLYGILEEQIGLRYESVDGYLGAAKTMWDLERSLWELERREQLGMEVRVHVARKVDVLRNLALERATSMKEEDMANRIIAMDFIARAQRMIEFHSYPEAITQYEEAAKADPTFFEIYTGLREMCVKDDVLKNARLTDRIQGILLAQWCRTEDAKVWMQWLRRLFNRKASIPSVKYFMTPLCKGDHAFCDDGKCDCGNFGSVILRGQGYLYVSKEVVDIRGDCLEFAAFEEKLEKIAERLEPNTQVMVAVVPELCCKRSAKRRRLNLAVAGDDARRWWSTGAVPLRMTPTR